MPWMTIGQIALYIFELWMKFSKNKKIAREVNAKLSSHFDKQSKKISKLTVSNERMKQKLRDLEAPSDPEEEQ